MKRTTAKRIALDSVQKSCLRKPDEWSTLVGPTVLDPDGWRSRAGRLEPRSFDDPITYDEFKQRAAYSTTMLHRLPR